MPMGVRVRTIGSSARTTTSPRRSTPTRHTLKAARHARYTNNSPDTLRFVWMQLDQNLYKAGSEGSYLFPEDSRWGVRGFEGGYDIRNLVTNGTRATVGGRRHDDAGRRSRSRSRRTAAR